MSKKSPDLHGHAPDNSPVALLLIDVINDLEFEGGEVLARYALPAAKKIAALKQRASLAGIPAIYVNDNFGKWRSDFTGTLNTCFPNLDITRRNLLWKVLYADVWPARRRGSGAAVVSRPLSFSLWSTCCWVM